VVFPVLSGVFGVSYVEVGHGGFRRHSNKFAVAILNGTDEINLRINTNHPICAPSPKIGRNILFCKVYLCTWSGTSKHDLTQALTRRFAGTVI
jgi:hypothetical protein